MYSTFFVFVKQVLRIKFFFSKIKLFLPFLKSATHFIHSRSFSPNLACVRTEINSILHWLIVDWLCIWARQFSYMKFNS